MSTTNIPHRYHNRPTTNIPHRCHNMLTANIPHRFHNSPTNNIPQQFAKYFLWFVCFFYAKSSAVWMDEHCAVCSSPFYTGDQFTELASLFLVVRSLPLLHPPLFSHSQHILKTDSVCSYRTFLLAIAPVYYWGFLPASPQFKPLQVQCTTFTQCQQSLLFFFRFRVILCHRFRFTAFLLTAIQIPCRQQGGIEEDFVMLVWKSGWWWWCFVAAVHNRFVLG